MPGPDIKQVFAPTVKTLSVRNLALLLITMTTTSDPFVAQSISIFFLPGGDPHCGLVVDPGSHAFRFGIITAPDIGTITGDMAWKRFSEHLPTGEEQAHFKRW